jgi:hypothetical protein
MLRLTACLLALAPALAALPDSSLNATEVAYSGPERAGLYLGSPSILRCPTSTALLVAHDVFGARAAGSYVSVSLDEGATWRAAGATGGTYWASLFARPGDPAVYALGTSPDAAAQVVLARSLDCGATFSPPVQLTRLPRPCSTGATPVLAHAGRLWRALEYNAGPAWAADYASFVLSAPANASDLLDPAAWTASGMLPFAAVAGRVPSNWSSPSVASAFGWLEGNAVAPLAPSDSGISVLLRVNSLPAGNKAALLRLDGASATPAFVGWVEFPGGMSKFTVRRDAASGQYLALVNPVADEGVSLPPLCAPLPASGGGGALQGPFTTPPPPLPCCSMNQVLACTAAPCLWCHANARSVLALATSPDLLHWQVAGGPPLLADDTAQPAWLSELMTGFQYADFIQEGGDLLAAVRAAYRGAQNYHNSNRILFVRVAGWAGRGGGGGAGAGGAAAAGGGQGQ